MSCRVFVHILHFELSSNLCQVYLFSEYRLAFMQQSPMMLQGAMKSFEEALKKFPDCSEGYALHGQVL